MGVLSGLAPQRVFYYFEEISRIPHGSGNVEKISDYLVRFAREHGLWCCQDACKNVVIVKEAAAGYEEEPPVILQGHMDMVAVHRPDAPVDMTSQGLRLGIDGDWLYAERTSLGGDDGVAIAYALALLEDDCFGHPRLEVVLTVDEEVGMDGARSIDLSMLRGERMVNLDSEEEGIFLTSCAGGARAECGFSYPAAPAEGALAELKVSGLRGGHSGEEIDKGRGNANCLLGRLLWGLAGTGPVRLVSVGGGLADNAIPREARAVLAVSPQSLPLLQERAAQMASQLGEEFAVRDPGLKVSLSELPRAEHALFAASPEDTRRLAAFLWAAPNGVQTMSADLAGLVETSLNLGLLTGQTDASGGSLSAVFSVRSSRESAKYAWIEKLRALAELAGAAVRVTGDYPGWQYRADSPLRDKMTALYRRMYGREPQVQAIHAGLECGLLAAKLPGLDCVSIGPDMRDIHTTEERLSISSTARVWEFLRRLLEEKEDRTVTAAP